MTSTPKVSRSNVRKLVYPTDEDELDFIFETWTTICYNDADNDSVIIAGMNDSVYLHQLKRYFTESSVSLRMFDYKYISAIVCAINARLFSLKCNCFACNVRWHNFFNTL